MEGDSGAGTKILHGGPRNTSVAALANDPLGIVIAKSGGAADHIDISWRICGNFVGGAAGVGINSSPCCAAIKTAPHVPVSLISSLFVYGDRGSARTYDKNS